MMYLLRDRKKVYITKYDPEHDFVSKDIYTCVFPIIYGNKTYPKNIVGSAFLIGYYGYSYIVTAKHVLKGLDDPVMLFTGKNTSRISLHTVTLNTFGLDWIKHSKLDLAVIPLLLPRIFDKQIINPHLTRTKLVDPTSIKKGIRVKHLGFGDQKTGVYTKRKKLTSTPWGAFGRFDSSTKTEITIQSPARYGDSGGPVFLKTTSGEALLIGVTKSTSVLPFSNVSLDDEYTGITKAVPIFYVLSMLHSEKMKSQIKTAKIQIQKIHDDYPFN